jgi:hypothetical protein
VNRPTTGVLHPATAASGASSKNSSNSQESSTGPDASERGRNLFSRFFTRLLDGR